MRYLLLIGLIPLIALLSGCPDPKAIKDGDELAGDPDSERKALTKGLGEEENLDAQALNEAKGPLYQRVFYFDFDSNKVHPEYLEAIAAHGRRLAANPNLKMRVEGHTDERGTREYNVGLSERRAQAVQRLLLFQGATKEQAETVAYGEELPKAFGHNEEAWSKNRRVELVYEGS